MDYESDRWNVELHLKNVHGARGWNSEYYINAARKENILFDMSQIHGIIGKYLPAFTFTPFFAGDIDELEGHVNGYLLQVVMPTLVKSMFTFRLDISQAVQQEGWVQYNAVVNVLDGDVLEANVVIGVNLLERPFNRPNPRLSTY